MAPLAGFGPGRTGVYQAADRFRALALADLLADCHRVYARALEQPGLLEESTTIASRRRCDNSPGWV